MTHDQGRREQLRRLLRKAKRLRKQHALDLTTIQSVQENQFAGKPRIISLDQEAAIVSWLASLDQQISTMEDMLTGRLPLDTLIR
jgi:hypothetical protein